MFLFTSTPAKYLSWYFTMVLSISNIFVVVMVNDVLYGLTPIINEKGSFFGVDMVGDTTTFTVFVSLNSIYYGRFNHHYSGYMVAFTIYLYRMYMLIFPWNGLGACALIL